MIQFSQLNSEEQMKIMNKALTYYKDHKSSIYSSIKDQKEKVAPTGSDLYSPELWKPSHWVWFLDNNLLL